MATRANILITDGGGFPLHHILHWEELNDTIICKHLDGYPEFMLPILKKAVGDGSWDKEQIIENLLNENDDFCIEDKISVDVEYIYFIDVEYKSLEFVNIGGKWVDVD